MQLFWVELSNQQSRILLSADFLKKMARGLELIGRRLKEEGRGEIVGLEMLEVALLDDCEMARVHGEFLGDPTTTDVITFDHGELLIGVEVAEKQRHAYGHSLAQEIFLYGIHGLLHLSGYNDILPADREKMWVRQDDLLKEFEINC